MINQIIKLNYESFKDLDLSQEKEAQKFKKKNNEASVTDTDSETNKLTDCANNLIQQLLSQNDNSNHLK